MPGPTDRFEHRGPLGAGGAGVVIRAFDRARGREVALKTVRFDPDAGRDIFEREVSALRGLAHPSLPRVIDLGLGRDATGAYGFYTAELLEAEPLDAWARARGWSERWRALRGPIEALLALHEAGLMHGDVAPANILVDGEGRGTLIDLSCARPLGEPLHTLDGTHPAPEIMRGARASVGIDLYALGVTLEGLLEGAPEAARVVARELAAPRAEDRPADLREVLERLGAPLPPRARPSSAFVGRASERAWFAERLRALRSGDAGPRALVIDGPAGIGKSRLLEQWRLAAQLEVAVDEAVGPAHLAGLLARAAADALPAWLARVRAAPQPTVWFIDDLERAPAEDRARLTRALRALEPTDPLLAVVVGGAPVEDAETLTLGPLAEDAARRWIGDGVTREAADRILEATGRVPADLELVLSRPAEDPAQLLREHLVDRGVLDALDPDTRGALLELACGGQPGRTDAPRLVAAGWARLEGGRLRLRRPGDARRVIGSAAPDELRATHRRLAERADGPATIAHLARAGDLEAAEAGLAARVARGEPARALRDAARALAPLRPSLTVAHVLERAGRAAEALSVLARLRRGADQATVDALRVRAGRCRLALGDPRAALRHLRRAQRASEPAVQRDANELTAQAYLRLGEHRRATETLRETEAALRPGALETLGVALSYLGEHEAAKRALDEAAAAELTPRARLRVTSFRAIDAYRRGRLGEAADGYRAAYAIATEHGLQEQLPQTALNLATVEHRLGDLGAALRRYDEALTWARALDRRTTEVTLRVNRARLFADIGAFERATEALKTARERADEAELRFLVAETWALEAELDWMRGAPNERAAARAIALYEASGARREVADTWLILAHARALGGDAASAQEALRESDAQPFEDLRARALEARAAVEAALGQPTDALRSLESARRLAAAGQEPALCARLDGRAAVLARRLSAPHAAEAFERAARASWDRMAATLPDELRAPFWSHPFRGAAIGRATTEAAGVEATTGAEATRLRALLRVASRVAEALDPDEVLELAMDSAIELTGAERGFVLLTGVDDDGLRVAVARNFDREDLARAGDKFSRTIAARVVEAGEPVLTSEAQRDARFAAGRSVHAMQLRSVLSVPIRTRERALGALYVDNRFQRGRFSAPHVELLTGLADQVAVALVNARLHRQLEARTRELAAERERTLAMLADKTAEVERLAAERVDGGFHGLVGRSPAMRETIAAIRRLADAPVTVLIEGESGAGKELVARAIHRAGPRREAPFVPVNCGAIPEALLESELFGHRRGAFTGADRDKRGLFLEAGRGTLLLDEVGEMPLGMQVKLLRALQQREVRAVGASGAEPFEARVLAATNRTLRDEVAAGRFREDLYYRLAVVELRVPPLRERAEDVPEIARALLSRIAERGGPRARLTAGAVRALQEHPWPGNVRQLENALHAAAVFADGGRIAADALVLPSPPSRAPLSERARIERALARHGWNVAQVSRALAIPRMTLYRRLRKYGLERPKSLGKRKSRGA